MRIVAVRSSCRDCCLLWCGRRVWKNQAARSTCRNCYRATTVVAVVAAVEEAVVAVLAVVAAVAVVVALLVRTRTDVDQLAAAAGVGCIC